MKTHTIIIALATAGISAAIADELPVNGTVDVHIGPKKPEGKVNWIKTNPGRGWFPYFRFYAPTEAYFDKSWSLTDIEKAK
jgi:hypothetical protein